MSEVTEAIHKMRISKDRGTIRGGITRVDSFARFSSGWIGYEFLYETPTLFVTCETEFGGEVQLEIPVNDFSESVLSRFLRDADVFDIEEGVDVNSIVGETVFIATDDDNTQATIGWSSDVNYDEDRHAIFRSDNFICPDEIDVYGGGIEPKSNEWMNDVLTNSYYRHNVGTHGWIEVNFEYVGESNDKYFFAAELPTGKEIYWSFDTDMQGVDTMCTFLSELGMDFTPDEFGFESVWVKPVREVHYTNRPSEDSSYLIDTEESFVADRKPRAPYEGEEEPTLIEKIKSFFSALKAPNNNSVLVSTSTSSPYRRAKSSQTKSAVTPNEDEVNEENPIKNETVAETA